MMQKHPLGKSALKVTPICLGTMTFGEQNSEAEAHTQLDFAKAEGINFIDAAEMYPVPVRSQTYGLTETYIGTWLKKQKRDDIVLATKIAGPARGMDWIRGGNGKVDAADVEAACNASLKRLQTDYIDLYQIHWPCRSVPVFGKRYFDPKAAERPSTSFLEQLQSLDKLVRAGKVRSIGLSNETPYGLMSFLQVAEQNALSQVVSVQNAFNLVNRHVHDGLDEVLHQTQVSLLAYSPLAFGRLTGKYEKGGTGRLTIFPPDWSPRYMRAKTIEASKRYAELAAEYKLTPTQLALAFCYQDWSVTSTIIGATHLSQLKENIDAFKVTLSAQCKHAIDAIRESITDPAR